MKQIIKKYCALLIALAMVLPVMSVRAFAAAQPSTKDGPAVEKIVTDNGDGTHKIKLELTGKVNTTHEVTKANVLVVLDLSGSMDYEAGTTTRLDAAKSAVNSVAETLLGKNGQNEAPNDLVEMGLVTFGTKAETKLEKTNSLSTFTDTVNKLSTYSKNYAGTNWEAALDAAKNFNFDDKDKTYVVFVSDGNPTFRNTRGNYHTGNFFDWWEPWDSEVWNSLHVYGDGQEHDENVKRAYEQSRDEARGIVTSGRELYTIGCFGNVTRMQELTNYAYNSTNSGKYYSASNAAQLSTALNEIATAISNSLGQSNVTVTDGVTSLSTISANVAGNLEGFIYKKNDKEWLDAPQAKIENHKVVWDLSSIGSLENGAKYSVEFDVWPSQDAFDLVADLNNGIQTYDSLSDEIKSQIKKDDDAGNYFLKTNTDLKTNFTYNSQNLEENFDAGNNSMEVLSSTISLEKLWENNLDNRSAEPVTLNLTKDGNVYLTKELNKNNNFKVENIYIAPGIIKENKVLEKGHDYSVTEPADSAYHWELNADTYHPMLIDGKLKMLKKDDNNGTYTIDGKKYSVVDAADATLKAKNSRRSYLNFTKKVTEAQANTANKDDLFSYNVKFDAADNKEVWFAVKDENDNYVTNLKTTATQDGDYYKVDSGKQFTVKLKRDWNFRAINLLSNTTYSIEETDIPDGYVFENYQINEGNIKVEGNKVTGTIAAANKAYTLTNTNKYNGYFYVYHSSNNQVEKVSITDSRVVNGKFDLTKEVSKDYLYGGYFKAYGQTTSTDEEIKALTYTDGKATDQKNGTPYTGSKATTWKAANAYHENGQIEFKPQVNKVYYLKEVPNTYFRPRMEIIYDTYNAEKPVTDLYLFTAVDDANYNSVSLNNENNTKLYLRATIRNYNGTVKRYLTVKGEFKSLSLPRGYIALINVKDKVKKQERFEYTPTYETLDGVKVSGVVKRRVDFGNGRFNPDQKTGDSIAPGLSHSDIEN
ncbi:von Willebrand factor type A domain-containing protein [Sharpea azabuensis]|uniref:vWA domain-containing protein n=1 Tax=Sharpea azabuensis TaxID=322505 RepID=UPI0008E65B8E|nr:vWA domain-containing protein [Sharpea azabuensis]SFD70776.1 von Willebrand factor type A domain-containing protein [Sharpea azabuensis]SFK68165.1 von Willebrand factor type A domain-containing protein [Sharpea azabuensis]